MTRVDLKSLRDAVNKSYKEFNTLSTELAQTKANIATKTRTLGKLNSALEEMKNSREKEYNNQDLEKAIASQQASCDQADAEIKQLKSKSESLKIQSNDAESTYNTLKKQLAEENELYKQEQAQEEAKKAEEESLAQKQEDAKKPRQILVNALHKKLDNYITNRATQYKFKDMLSDRDKNARNAFVDAVKTLLRSYVNSGNTEETCKFLTALQPGHPGLHIKSTLNQIIMELYDAAEPAITLKSEDEIQELLNTSQEAYYKKIKLLRDLIMQLNEKSQEPEVVNLAENLKTDIDRLISKYPDAAPEEDKFKEFQAKFIIRLHSQDAMMNKYTSTKAAIIDILKSIGELLQRVFGAQQSENPHRLFRTNKERAVDGIEDALKKVSGTEPGA